MSMLTVDLDDEATEGLVSLDQILDRLNENAQITAKGFDQLTAAQERELTVIQRQEVGFSKLADSAISAVDHLGTEAVRAFSAIETATIRAGSEMSKLLVKEGASLIKWAIGATAVLGGLSIVFGQNSKSVKDHEEALQDDSNQQTQWLGLNARMVASLAGFGPYVMGATLAIKAQAAVLDVTGRKFVGMVEDSSGATEAQTKAFQKFVAEANELGVTLDDLAQSRGIQDVDKYLQEAFGVRNIEVYESNLTRLQGAFGEFGDEIAASGASIKQGFKDWWNTDSIFDFSETWKEFDAGVTRSTDRMIENVGHVKRAYSDWFNSSMDGLLILSGDMRTAENNTKRAVDAYRQFGGDQQKIRDNWISEGQAITQLGVEAERVMKIQLAAAESISRVKVQNAQFDKIDEARAEAKAISELRTAEAIKSEISALLEARNVRAATGQLDEADAKRVFEKREALVRRLAAVEAEEHTLRMARQKAWIEAEREEAEAFAQMAQTRREREIELFTLNQKRLDQQAKLAGELVVDQNRQNNETALAGAKDVHATNKQLITERLKAQGVEEAQIKSQLALMDREFAEGEHRLKMAQIEIETKRKLTAIEEERDANAKFGGTDTERKKKDIELLEQADKALFERRKKAIEENGRFEREINKLNLDDKRQAELGKLKAEEDRLKKAKALEDELNQRVKSSFDAKSFMQNADPNKVFKQFSADRGEQEQQRQADRDLELFQRAQSGNQAAAKRYVENQRRANRRGQNQAENDFQNGNVGENEWQKAQAEVSQQTVAGMGKVQGINQQLVTALQGVLQTEADNQTAMFNTQTTLNALLNAQKGIKSTAKAQASNTQLQIGSLN